MGAGIRALALGEGAGDWAGWITEGDSEQGTGASVSGYVPSALTAQPWESGGPGTCPGHVWGRVVAPVPRPLRACPGFRGLSRPQRRVHGPRGRPETTLQGGGGGAVAAEDRRVRTPYAGSASGVEYECSTGKAWFPLSAGHRDRHRCRKGKCPCVALVVYFDLSFDLSLCCPRTCPCIVPVGPSTQRGPVSIELRGVMR